jgi:hypothetical protein
MTDTARVNAVSRRDAIAAEINTLQQRLDDLRREAKTVDAWLTAWDAFAGIARGEVPSRAPLQIKEPQRKGRSTNPPKEEIAEFARKLAEDRGAPVSRKAIATALEQEGTVLEGSDPDMVLSTMLWRMKDRIVRLKGFGYWPREMDYEPASYKANTVPEDESGRRRYEQIYNHPTSIAGLEAAISKEDGDVS